MCFDWRLQVIAKPPTVIAIWCKRNIVCNRMKFMNFFKQFLFLMCASLSTSRLLYWNISGGVMATGENYDARNCDLSSSSLSTKPLFWAITLETSPTVSWSAAHFFLNPPRDGVSHRPSGLCVIIEAFPWQTNKMCSHDFGLTRICHMIRMWHMWHPQVQPIQGCCFHLITGLWWPHVDSCCCRVCGI